MSRWWPTLAVLLVVAMLVVLFPDDGEEPCNQISCPYEAQYDRSIELTAIAEGKIERD